MADSRPDPPGDDGLGGLRRGLNGLQRLLSSRRVHQRWADAAGAALPQQAIGVLRAVAAAREPLAVAEVSRSARMDVGAVSRQVRTLESAGLVRRGPAPTNASVVLVEATAAGVELAARIEAVQHAHLREALASWSLDERRQLGELLVRLVDDLQRTPYRPTPGEPVGNGDRRGPDCGGGHIVAE